MTVTVPGLKRLRALHRRYKLLLVLAAAWAPILLAANPILACGVVIVATTLFWVSVSTRVTPPDPPTPKGHPDEEP